MSKKVRVKVNYAGVGELMRSREVQDMLKAEAEKRAPDGCEVDVYVGRNRANARITAVTDEARRENLAGNTLRKAIGG